MNTPSSSSVPSRVAKKVKGESKTSKRELTMDPSLTITFVAEDLSLPSKKMRKSKPSSSNNSLHIDHRENTKLPEGTNLKTGVITQIMDIQQPVSKLRSLLEAELGIDLSNCQIWLQDKNKIDAHISLSKVCTQSDGMAQVKLEMNHAAGQNRINIVDILPVLDTENLNKVDEETLEKIKLPINLKKIGRCKYDCELVDPLYVQEKGKIYNPKVRCLEMRDGKECGDELGYTNIYRHFDILHAKNEKVIKSQALSDAKKQQEATIGSKYVYFQLSQQSKGRPDSFNVLPLGDVPKGKQAKLIAETKAINKIAYDATLTVDKKPYHGTVIMLFKPRNDDDKMMNVEQMLMKYDTPDSDFEVFMFYDTSTRIGPCYPTHLRKNSTSQVTRMVLIEGYSMFIVRIIFDGKSKVENMHDAMDWQNEYTVLAHHMRVHGHNAPGIKVRMLNQTEVQKNGYTSVHPPEKFQEGIDTVVYGKRFFYPLKGYETLPWVRFTFPKTTTVFVPPIKTATVPTTTVSKMAKDE